MKKFNDYKIGTRLIVLITSAFILAAVINNVFFVISAKKNAISVSDSFFEEELKNLYEIIDIQIQNNQRAVDISLNLAHEYFYNLGNLKEDPSEKIEFSAVNQITKGVQPVYVNKWELNGKQIQNNFDIVDSIKALSVETVTIFQKIEDGYLRVSTNVMKLDGSRAVGTFIPNNSPVIQAIESGETFRGRAFVVNDWYLTAYEPIYVDGEIQGILYVGLKEKNLGELTELLASKKYYESGYPYIVQENGYFVYHPVKTKDDNINEFEFFQEMLKNKDEKVHKYAYQWEGKDKFQYYIYSEAIKSFVSVTIYEKDYLNRIYKQIFSKIIITLIGIIVFVIIILLISRNLSKSLNKGITFAKEISSGNLNATIDIDQKDEIGLLSNELRTMRESLKRIINSVQENIANVSSASNQLSSLSGELSSSANEQAATSEEIAVALEEMLITIENNTKNAVETGIKSQETAKNMQENEKIFIDTTNFVREISEKSLIISEIAKKTDLLAINAAIEAAKSGESGKGFQVIAQEIRKLSDLSRLASGEISKIANDGLKYSQIAEENIKRAIPEIIESAKLVNEIVDASKSQQTNTDAINISVQQQSETTTSNSTAAEEMSTAAEELSAQTDNLKDLISFFKIDNDSK